MKINSANINVWSKLGQRGSIFGVGLVDLSSNYSNLRVLSADLSYLSGLDRFIRKFPEKFLQVGIAEQNMMCIASGLAMEGECVIATTYSSFIAVRSLEQIRQNISHCNANVKVIGTSAGVVAAKSGVSHWATEDLAFMRVLPNFTVFSPADSLEAIKCLDASLKINGPVYIRVSGGLNCPIVYSQDYDFEPGKILNIKKGEKIAILATGLMVAEAIGASEILERKGINCSVYNVHTIKPLDKKTLDSIFSDYDLIVTVEEHNILGGLGSSIAEYKATKRRSPRQIFLGFPDTFTQAGSQRYIWNLVGITSEQIANRIMQEVSHD